MAMLAMGYRGRTPTGRGRLPDASFLEIGPQFSELTTTHSGKIDSSKVPC